MSMAFLQLKKEGIAISISFHLILLKDCAIKTPTIINAGAVTCEVTTANKGENSKLKINKIPVVIAAYLVTTTHSNPRR